MPIQGAGSLDVVDGQGPLELGSTKQRALLAILLLNPNRVVPRDRLIDELWPHEPPERAVASVHVYVSRLRKVLPDRLLRRHPGYALQQLNGDELDLDRFERLVAEGRDAVAGGDAERGAELFADALALWRGRPLAEFESEPWAQAEIARLEDARLAAIEERIAAELALGRHARVIAELECLSAEHPTREGFREQLMLALYRAGRQAEALDAYRTGRGVLSDLGLEPAEGLRELERKILNHDPSLEPPQRRAAQVDLPVPATSFVGRKRELDEIEAMLVGGEARLVTLTGAAGSGKTRLAIEAAGRVASEFGDGVFFVPLEDVREAALVAPAIARVLAVQATPDELEPAIETRLRDRRVLLVLDNFEQVLAAASAIGRLVTPTSAFLVTSRAPLHVAGEHEYGVPTLAPAEARELFVERARSVLPRSRPPVR